jgi:hypothetical protein
LREASVAGAENIYRLVNYLVVLNYV